MSREVIHMGRPYVCPYCKSKETTSKGARKTKLLGVRRIRRCRACGRKFTPKHQPEASKAPDSDQPRVSVIEPQPPAEPAQPRNEAVLQQEQRVEVDNKPAEPGASDLRDERSA